MRIPVVFATDENYLFYVCVAITSMAQNAKEDTFYQIYALVAPEFDDKEHLLDKLQQRYHNIRIEVVCVNEMIFRDVTIHNQHVTKATFYRLALCDLIKEDKCIYLDGDILVTEDLGELYQTDMEDNYLAGRQTFGRCCTRRRIRKNAGQHQACPHYSNISMQVFCCFI